MRKFNTGKGSASRSDASSAVGGPDWIQEGLFPPSIVEVDIRVRVAVASGTAQIQIEIIDPITKELLGMRSRPPHAVGSAEQPLTQAYTWCRQALELLLNPEPF